MRILLTGGSGDLGTMLCKHLAGRGDEPVNFDVCKPLAPIGKFIEGSILERSALRSALSGIDCVVHIAAWHGIHEFRKEKDAFDFWDLNVTGTFNVLELCAQAGCSKIVFISSTSVDDATGLYGNSKVIAEELAATYRKRHGMQIITLRPRAFIPHWNKSAYATFEEWARWYWKGAVHINDVAQSVWKAVDTLAAGSKSSVEPLVVDGLCEFSKTELDTWDAAGAGDTFRKRFGGANYRLAVDCGLDPSVQPSIIGTGAAQRAIGYVPTYGFAHMLDELAAKHAKSRA